MTAGWPGGTDAADVADNAGGPGGERGPGRASSAELKSAQFRREREGAWRRLEVLVGRVEATGIRSLSPAELHQLPSLYRAGASSLSVARAISLDKNLLAYLTALVSRAHLCVYRPTRRTWDVLAGFATSLLPRTVRRYLPYVALAWALVAAGTLTGLALTRADPDFFFSVVGRESAGSRSPAASTPELRAVLYARGGGWSGALAALAAYLFSHNTRVGLLCFGLGFAAGVPVLYLLFLQGLNLGAMAAIYQARGLGGEFWAWILPHGITELGGLCLFGAGGLAIGSAMLFPGRRTRLAAMAERGREAALLALGGIGMLLVAGLIEGFFRQLVQDVAVRWAVAGASAVFWLWYFLYAGGEAEERRVAGEVVGGGLSGGSGGSR